MGLMLMTSREFAEEHGLKIRATLESFFTIGTDTVFMLTGPLAEPFPEFLKCAQNDFG